MANPKKKQKRTVSDSNSASPSTLTLTCLPLELLSEVLLYTCSPSTVLSVSRTCSYLYRTLVLNPTASFIWRGVRTTCKPRPLPSPTSAWKGTEAEYAAFIFSKGLCEICKKEISLYASFAARVRVCNSYACRKKFLVHNLIDVTTIIQTAEHPIWLPCIESTRCFSPTSYVHSNWPENGTVLLRKSEWEKSKSEWNVYVAAEASAKTGRETQVLNAAAPEQPPATTSEQGESAEPALRRDDMLTKYRDKIARFKEIMSLSVQLLEWKYVYEQTVKDTKLANETWAKDLALREGWNVADLLSCPAYSALSGHLTRLMDVMTNKLFRPIQPIVESQLLSMKEHQERAAAEKAYRTRLTSVKSLYERMKSKGATTLPPLSIFLELPSVRAIRGRPNPGATPMQRDGSLGDLNNNEFATSLIKSDISAWVDSARTELLKELGFPDGWKSASSNKLDPLYRITAKFLCTRCVDGGVNEKTKMQGCLDFFDVCAHVCRTKKRNTARPVGRRIDENGTQEKDGDNGMTDVDGEAQDATTKNRRKRKSNELDWRVSLFKRDDKAIALIDRVLHKLGLSAEYPHTIFFVETLARRIRCLSCKSRVVMDFQNAIGHCHRHESMQILILPSGADTSAFEPGLSSRLLNKKALTREIVNEANYGCSHCVKIGEDDASGKGGVKPMTGNGLRSHLKEKHQIKDLRDEDVFCFKPVDWSTGTFKENRSGQ